MIAEIKAAFEQSFHAGKMLSSNQKGQSSGITVIAAVMLALVLTIFLSVTLMNALNLNTGLYSTVITVLFPLLLFAGAVGFIIKFL